MPRQRRFELATRGVALGRKGTPFAGSDCGAAFIYLPIATAELNNIDPEA